MSFTDLNLRAAPHRHDPDDLIQIFNALFRESQETILVRGDDEPVYLPKDAGHAQHRVIFAHGFYASALHEIAHWCIAGPKRRLLTDFGYWYKPDGRTLDEQQAFERVEVKPQALEWILSTAAGHPFHFSADNLSGQNTDMREFKQNVVKRAHTYCRNGLPKRADQLARALAEIHQTGDYRDIERYRLNAQGKPIQDRCPTPEYRLQIIA